MITSLAAWVSNCKRAITRTRASLIYISLTRLLIRSLADFTKRSPPAEPSVSYAPKPAPDKAHSTRLHFELKVANIDETERRKRWINYYVLSNRLEEAKELGWDGQEWAKPEALQRLPTDARQLLARRPPPLPSTASSSVGRTELTPAPAHNDVSPESTIDFQDIDAAFDKVLARDLVLARHNALQKVLPPPRREPRMTLYEIDVIEESGLE